LNHDSDFDLDAGRSAWNRQDSLNQCLARVALVRESSCVDQGTLLRNLNFGIGSNFQPTGCTETRLADANEEAFKLFSIVGAERNAKI
jgi:hypothetical protein